ncbi:MAG TPA: hypothetical protein VE650_07600 [Acetobacteraceae bacterium]|nr:hypothetical protein [Acetobacteraceae bacterium]
MATRSRAKAADPTDAEVLRAILGELQALNRTVDEISARIAAHAEADLDPERPRDPGDSVPPGVAPQEPAPLTPEDKKVRRALEHLPTRRNRLGGSSARQNKG